MGVVGDDVALNQGEGEGGACSEVLVWEGDDYFNAGVGEGAKIGGVYIIALHLLNPIDFRNWTVAAADGRLLATRPPIGLN